MTKSESSSLMTRVGPTLAVCALLSGCQGFSPINGAFLGNLVVLAVTLGIFFSTLALGRSAPSAGASARSTPEAASSRSPS